MTNKEYTIFITCKGGRAYNLCTFKTFPEVIRALEGMIKLENERHRPYYVFNDFYVNEYPANLSGKTFCIKERTVTEWEKYSHKNTFEKEYNNIYQFPNLF